MSNFPSFPSGNHRTSNDSSLPSRNPGQNRNPSHHDFLPRSPTHPQTTYTVSAAGITLHPRHSSSVNSSHTNVTRSGDNVIGKRNSSVTDEDDDDEEVEIKISPTGSVLAPSPNPYDKTQKLRQANAQLMASRLPPKPPGKVRFNESAITTEEPGGDHAIRSKKPKTNVTLPPTLKKN